MAEDPTPIDDEPLGRWDYIYYGMIVLTFVFFGMALLGFIGERLGWWNDVGEALMAVGTAGGALVGVATLVAGASRSQVRQALTAVRGNGETLESVDGRLESVDGRLESVDGKLDQQTRVLVEIRDRL